uniref:Regulating synaptic membrane exocytosis 1 n=1 Tax=Pavo cristatus TaxID=9049 RepID=A0A8C9FIA4_PAVCR
MERPSISVISPTSPGALRDAPQVLPGQLSVKLWYDKVGHQLIVNVLQATDLPPRVDGRPRNPYVKMYFLPDRSDKSKRRTKTVKKSLEPKWNQTFLYSHVHRRDFRERMLEITVWDQPRVQEEESEFLGEILIELETALLDDEPHWYKLQTHDESSLPLPQPSPFMPRRHVHGGESSSKKLQRSRPISDSDISDYDVDDGIGVVPPGYRSSTRESRSTTLTVPEQQRTIHHRSRSVSPHRGDDQGRTRSRLPNVPSQRSLDEIHQMRRSRSPTRHHEASRSPADYRSRDMDSQYLSDQESELLMLPRAKRGRSAECLHTISELQPSLDRARSASTNCLRPDTSLHSPERERYKIKTYKFLVIFQCKLIWHLLSSCFLNEFTIWLGKLSSIYYFGRVTVKKGSKNLMFFFQKRFLLFFHAWGIFLSLHPSLLLLFYCNFAVLKLFSCCAELTHALLEHFK